MTTSVPQVTIGLPVRNGEPLLTAAVDSLLSQTYRDFTLVISDNHSDDGTENICRAYAAADSRIQYIRQPVNLGNPGNFRFTLQAARTPYFMWAAHDDVWAPSFIEKNLAVLTTRPEVVGCVSKVTKVYPNGVQRISTGTHALRGDAKARLKNYFTTIGDASRFYGLFRTASLQPCFPKDVEVFGFDLIVMALNLAAGEHAEIDEVLLVRKAHADGHYFRTLLKTADRRIDRLVPYRQLSLKLRDKLPPDLWAACRSSVLRLNAVQMLQLAKYEIPALAPVVNAVAAAEKRVRRFARAGSAAS